MTEEIFNYQLLFSEQNSLKVGQHTSFFVAALHTDHLCILWGLQGLVHQAIIPVISGQTLPFRAWFADWQEKNRAFISTITHCFLGVAPCSLIGYRSLLVNIETFAYVLGVPFSIYWAALLGVDSYDKKRVVIANRKGQLFEHEVDLELPTLLTPPRFLEEALVLEERSVTNFPVHNVANIKMLWENLELLYRSKEGQYPRPQAYNQTK